jgi:hypothetical protein
MVLRGISVVQREVGKLIVGKVRQAASICSKLTNCQRFLHQVQGLFALGKAKTQPLVLMKKMIRKSLIETLHSKVAEKKQFTALATRGLGLATRGSDCPRKKIQSSPMYGLL